jgi:hypothetical protein
MGTSLWRRLGAILLIVLVLGLGLVPAAVADSDQAPANAPSAGCAPTYYHVCYGDTLAGIAGRYGVSTWQLQQWNGIADPNRIYAGQTFVIYGCGYGYPQPQPYAHAYQQPYPPPQPYVYAYQQPYPPPQPYAHAYQQPWQHEQPWPPPQHQPWLPSEQPLHGQWYQ